MKMCYNKYCYKEVCAFWFVGQKQEHIAEIFFTKLCMKNSFAISTSTKIVQNELLIKDVRGDGSPKIHMVTYGNLW